LQEELSAAILCGGRSSRFVQDKTLVSINGKPMVQHVYHAVKGFSSDIFLVSKWIEPGKYQFLDIPVVYEPYKDYAPLYGIEQALIHAKNEWVLVLAADMPNLRPQIFQRLLDARKKTSSLIIPMTDRLHPLFALYSKTCLPLIRQRIQNDELKLQKLAEIPNSEVVSIEGEWKRAFVNINTQEDLGDFYAMNSRS